MNGRIFGVADLDPCNAVYDPCSDAIHLPPAQLPPGRRRLASAEVETWPEARPHQVQRAVPVSVCWSPIVRCNLACAHCLDDKAVSELPATQRGAVADLIGASGVSGVDISGGEPLLLPDLTALAARLSGHGCVVSVTTNGWHLARRTERLASAVDAVRVSLDGPDPDRHDALRGAGSFTRAIDGIRASLGTGIPTQIQTVLMATTAPDAQRLVELAAELGVHGVTFLQLLPIGDGAGLPTGELLTDHQAADVLAALAVPEPLRVRLRTRQAAAGFAVVRADGLVWRNDPHALRIAPVRPLSCPKDIARTSDAVRGGQGIAADGRT